jgi:hypothetical protein
MARPFQNVAGNRPGRSAFNLSHSKTMTVVEMGALIPTLVLECVPGDIHRMDFSALCRFMPMVSPMMHDCLIKYDAFFVPNRILDEEWEDFITGGEDGDYSYTLPTWNPTSTAVHTLWDYLDLPVGVSPPAANRPLAYPLYAYNQIYNDYYRAQKLITEVALTDEDMKYRSWTKDYFSSASNELQRGDSPAVPLSGTIEVDGDGGDITIYNANDATNRTIRTTNTSGNVQIPTAASAVGNARWASTGMEVDLTGAGTFNISDLRRIVAIQQWKELNERAGSRYVEWVPAHFGPGVGPKDYRLQRAEYIGGVRQPIIVSEVLQTESSDASTPQGTMAGHGISADRNHVGTYRCHEHGWIIGIMSIVPQPVYHQGMSRWWNRQSRFDFYSPEFAHLSEQGIETQELYATTNQTTNETVFGYQGVFDEMRVMPNRVNGLIRPGSGAAGFEAYTLTRDFASQPLLNQSFLECKPSKRAFAAQDPTDPIAVVQVGNKIKSLRPLPVVAAPAGLLT